MPDFYDFSNPVRWFDAHGQWFILHVVYQHELICLVLASCLVLLKQRSKWWSRLVRWPVLTVIGIYLVVYDMHWYSAIAWPLMLAVLTFYWCRKYWYRVLDLRLPRLRWRTAVNRWWAALQHACRDPRRTTAMLGIAAVALILIVLGSPRPDLIVILLVVGGGCGLLAWIFARRAQDRPGLTSYLDADPRMADYLDLVRLLRAEEGRNAGSRLADKRLEGEPVRTGGFNLWRSLFRLALLVCRTPFGAVIRLGAEHEWMPTIKSAYITQTVESARTKAWGDYEQARYPDLDEEEDPRNGDSYERDRPLNCTRLESLHNQQMRWLALTEAIAECHALCRPAGPPTGADMPDVLWAAELLNHAVEAQLEVVYDLRPRGSRPPQYGERVDDGDGREIRRALHFLELSVYCVEIHLEPDDDCNGLDKNDASSVTGHRERFCGPLFGQNGLVANPASPTPDEVARYWLRRSLLARYHLFEQLVLRSQSKRERLASSLGSQRQLPPHADWAVDYPKTIDCPEILLARLADHTAWASLWLELGRGDQARMTWYSLPRSGGHAGRGGGSRALDVGSKATHPACADRLAEVEACEARLQALTSQDPELAERSSEALRRLVHLWALSVEQDLGFLHVGSDIWLEQCELAANLYAYSGSPRIRWIRSRVQSAGLGHEPDRALTANRESETPIEIG